MKINSCFDRISNMNPSIYIETYRLCIKGVTEDAGRIGLVIVISGMAGSMVCGIILDKTHKYKVHIDRLMNQLIDKQTQMNIFLTSRQTDKV